MYFVISIYSQVQCAVIWRPNGLFSTQFFLFFAGVVISAGYYIIKWESVLPSDVYSAYFEGILQDGSVQQLN